MLVPHFEQVDLARVEAVFTRDGQHRARLKIPFLLRESGRTLCIVGQNPSKANAEFADRTIRFLERFVFERMQGFGQILMLNVYSRIDTPKKCTDNLNDEDCECALRDSIRDNNEFLMAFGKLKNEGAYRFPDRASELRPLFKGKDVYKFDIGADFAPHPGNPKILYRNFDVGIASYNFSDVLPVVG